MLKHICKLFKIRPNIRRKTHRGSVSVDAIASLVELFLPDIRAFFASEEGQKEFAEWQKQRQQETDVKKTM